MQQPKPHPNARRENRKKTNKRATLTPTAGQEIHKTYREARGPTKQIATGQNTKRKRETSISIDRDLVHKHLKAKDATPQNKMPREDIQMVRNQVDVGNDVPLLMSKSTNMMCQGNLEQNGKSPKYRIFPQIQAGIRKLFIDCQRDLVPSGMA